MLENLGVRGTVAKIAISVGDANGWRNLSGSGVGDALSREEIMLFSALESA